MVGQIVEILLPFLSIMARIIEVHATEIPKRYTVESLDKPPQTYTIFDGEFR